MTQSFFIAAFLLSLSYASGFSSTQTAISKHSLKGSSSRLYASAVIVQNKGGGHGEIGYQLAKLLLLEDEYKEKIDKITILQDDECDMEIEPFRSYGKDLEGVEVNYLPLGNGADWIDKDFMQNMLGGKKEKFDYVFDNSSKKPVGVSKALVDCAADWDNLKVYSYVSSAGIYTPSSDGPFPMSETTPVKESAGQYQFEQYVLEKGLPLVAFRPQYIYGPKANKFDYLDYYFEHLRAGSKIPIPGDGSQMVSLTNAQDVASLMASVIGKEEAAIEQRYFNCGTDKLVSYKDLAEICAKAASISEFEIKSTGSEKGDFPFRATNFYVAPDQAKSLLGWKGPKHSLEDDLVWYYEDYMDRNPFIDAVIE